jgi:hypothetical protein
MVHRVSVAVATLVLLTTALALAGCSGKEPTAAESARPPQVNTQLQQLGGGGTTQPATVGQRSMVPGQPSGTAGMVPGGPPR